MMESLENCKNKIFKSLYYLNYKDEKLEAIYKKKTHKNSPKMFLLFSYLLLFFSIFMCLFEGSLIIMAGSNINKNLKWNFVFIILNFVISVIIFLFSLIKPKIIESGYINFIFVYLLFFCFENNNLSLSSLLIVYFRSGIEIISFLFLVKFIIKFFISFFASDRIAKTFLIVLLNLIFNIFFLFRIHVIKEIVYYLITEASFSILLIILAFLSEFIARVYNFSVYKLEKEREYHLDTLKFFNISYFKSKNFEITNSVKLDEILANNSMVPITSPRINNVTSLNKIEFLMKNLVQMDDELPKELEDYLLDSISKDGFKFKKLIDIINFKMRTEDQEEFRNYTKVGILKLKNSNKEDTYFQMFLKIKLKQTQTEKNCINSDIIKTDPEKLYTNVKIEGILLDITQTYLKKQTQTNSLVLSKYIHDIKSPLFLLKQVINKYKKQNNVLFSNIQPLFTNESLVTHESCVVTTGVRHEIKSSISKIREHSKYVRIISKNIFQLIESINNFTKKQNNFISSSTSLGQKTFYYQKVDIRKLVNACVDFYNISVNFNPHKNSLKLLSEIEDKVPKFIFSNKLSIKQVVMNLLSNSIKFTNKGEIKVVCKYKTKYELEEKEFIEITVVDTGCGIEEENLPKLCQPFGITTGNKGSGLGLCIVHDLLATLNSKLSIFSKKNKGSAFAFDILVEKKYSSDSRESNASSSPESSFEYKNLLENSFIDNNTKPLDVMKNWGKRMRRKSLVSQESIESTRTAICEEPLNKMTILKNEFYLALVSAKNFRDENNEKEIAYMNDQVITTLRRTSSISDLGCFVRAQVISKTDKVANDQINKIFKKTLATASRKNFEFEQNIKSVDNTFLDINKQSSIKDRCKDYSIDLYNKQKYKNNSFYYPKRNTNISLSILLVDDDPVYLKQLSDQMQSISTELDCLIKVNFAYDPIEGLLNIYTSLQSKNEFFDLILLDENMPFMKGSTFARLYKTLFVFNGFYRIPLVSISSEIMSSNDQDGTLRQHFDYFLDKPCKKKEIKAIFEEVLKTKSP